MRCLFVSLLCCVALLAAPVRAQSPDAARSASARALFEEGVQHADAGLWTEAADRFQRALTLRDSQVIRFNLAAALSELGRVVEASELLRQVERDPAVDAALREDAQSKLARVSARIAKLTIQLDQPTPGVSVVLDDHELDAVMIGVAIPSDPGEHSVRAEREGEPLDVQQVTLTYGSEQTVTLVTQRVATPSEAAATVVPVAAPVAPRAADPKDGQRSKLLWWGVGAGAVAVVAIAVVSAVAATSSGSSSATTYQGDFDPPSVPVKVGP